MVKARRQMEERLKAVDMIIELRDARIPLASKNPMLAEMAPQKPRMVILTKTDMADPEETEKWIRSLTDSNAPQGHQSPGNKGYGRRYSECRQEHADQPDLREENGEGGRQTGCDKIPDMDPCGSGSGYPGYTGCPLAEIRR